MSIIDTLIVDRTQADVEEVRRIRNKILSGGLSSLTSEIGRASCRERV